MTAAFYDCLAPSYHFLYNDWETSMQVQATALAELLTRYDAPPGSQLLDSACGIGTQALGLSKLGYAVTASDISSGAISRLPQEAIRLQCPLDRVVDDLRVLARTANQSMDAVIACDNSLPHLLTDTQLVQAFESALRVLRPGAVAVYSVRDYAGIERNNPDIRPYGVHYDGCDRVLLMQLWEWQGDQYDLRLYLTRESPGSGCTTQVLVTRYYAVSIDHLMDLMATAGFLGVERHDGVLFQPIILGRKPLQ